MNVTKADRLTSAIEGFLASSPDVEAVAVVSFDGLVMAAALPDQLEEDRVGAMSAALLGLGEQAVRGLGCGQLNQLFVEGDQGFVFLMSARDQAVLAAVTSRAAKVGFVLFEMRRAAEAVGALLEDEDPAENVGVAALAVAAQHAPDAAPAPPPWPASSAFAPLPEAPYGHAPVAPPATPVQPAANGSTTGHVAGSSGSGFGWG